MDLACHSSCQTCKGSRNDECTSCKKDFYLNLLSRNTNYGSC